MRASAVKQAIADKLEAITPDDMATHRDRFVAVDLRHRSDAGVVMADRTFVVELAQVAPSTLISPGTQVITYDVHVFYSAQDGIEDRVAKDAERLIDALYLLHTEAADIYFTAIQPLQLSDTAYDGLLEAVISVDVTYKTDI